MPMRNPASKKLRKAVGKMLSKERKAKKMSMETVGQELGVARSTVHNLEHGLMASHFELVVCYARLMGDQAMLELNKSIATFRF